MTPELLTEAAIFAAGIGLLVGGAWLLVEGGMRVAAVMGVPTVIVGLTVVAFGTSAPELFVSLIGTMRGNTGLVLGNVIGSNVANLGLILAAAALLRPVIVERGLSRREIPLLLVVSAVFAALVWDGELSRIDAGVLVAGFVAFMVWTIRYTDRGTPGVTGNHGPVSTEPGHRMRQGLSGAGLVLLGVGGLAGGGQLIVDSALKMAGRFGVSETLIGLTLVAVGTSLPELATTVVAALRNEDDLALGNIVGSNLFNILAVAGPVGLIRPLTETSGQGRVQLTSMMLVTILVYVMITRGGGAVGRGRGAVLLLLYLLIMVVWMTGS